MRRDAFDPADVQHRGRVARLGRDCPDALHGVDEDREAHAERDHRDPHGVAEAEDDDRDRDDRDRRGRPRELESGSSVRLAAREAPMTSPTAMPSAAPIAKPAASRFRLAATSERNSRGRPDRPRPAPATSLAGGTEERGPRARAQTSQTHERRGEDGQRRGPAPRCGARRGPHAPSLLAGPEQRRALHGAEHDVDEVADQPDQDDRGVQLRKLERDLLPLHVRADAVDARRRTRPSRRRAARSTALTRIPVAMLGSAAGSVTRTSLPSRPTPDVRATS